MNITIRAFWEFNKCLQDVGARVDGGYPTFFLCSDGEALSFQAAKESADMVRDAIITDDKRSGWHVCGMAVNWEDPELYCSHTGEHIEPAYAEN